MKIVLTGGGTGGHFYPLIAVAEALNKQITEEKILESSIYYFADTPYDKEALYENKIHFIRIPSGKLRIYFSFENITDIAKTLSGIIKALRNLFKIYPDAIFSKGGYASFPTLCAAWILGIPVIIHESDTVPGRVNKWAAKFAKYIAVSYQEAAEYFPQEKTAWVGQPMRDGVTRTISDGAHEYLHLDPAIPVLVVLGGSQGAKFINDVIVQSLPQLVEKYQIIHQAGIAHVDGVKEEAANALLDNPYESRYTCFGFLDELALQMAGGAADVVLTRAGSMLFEIAAWQVPAIVVPITKSHEDHQIKNAYAFAHIGAGIVVKEKNLTPSILLGEVHRLTTDTQLREEMMQAGKEYTRKDASQKIAKQLLSITLAHEKE